MLAIYSKDYYQEHRERILATSASYYQRNKKRFQETQRKYRWETRTAALDAYGGNCACCGEIQQEFLSIDHINNDGAAHRKQLSSRSRGGGGSAMYQWLKTNGYPDGFQVLCFNCNMAKGFYGQCPHSTK
ncbi:hypothetical protein LCGC14_1601870 [marine sediment metagenome]|uniref:Uncharacterized protein n=1 Tax=marine sediment metagenome TaxID=412755 RepID=A0A0F9KRJ4_9ZZZZ